MISNAEIQNAKKTKQKENEDENEEEEYDFMWRENQM